MAFHAASSRNQQESRGSFSDSSSDEGEDDGDGSSSLLRRIHKQQQTTKRRIQKQQRQCDAMQKTLESIATQIGAETHGVESWDDKADAAFYGRTFGCALGIAEDHIEELHAAFDRYDVDNDHSVMDASSLGAMLGELGVILKEGEIDELFEAFDVDGDGSFTFDELILLLAGQSRSRDGDETAGSNSNNNNNKIPASKAIAARFLGAKETLKQKWSRSLSRLVDKHESEMQAYAAFTEISDEAATKKAARRNISPSRIGSIIYKFFPIHPHSVCHGAWDLGMSVLLVIVLVTLPVTIAFDKIADEMFIFNFIVDCLFIIDVLKNFLTGYVSTRIMKVKLKDRHCTLDPIILNWRKIWLNYSTTWFIPDLVSSIPIDAIFRWGVGKEDDDPNNGRGLATMSKTLKLLRLTRLTKLFRLLRMSRAFRYIRFAKSYIEDTLKVRIPMYVIKMVRLLVITVFVSHVMGCVNFFAVRSFEFPPESWVAQLGLQHESGYVQYTWSMFKALYTIIGGEEMLPSGVAVGCETVSHGSPWCEFESWLQLMSLYVGILIFALVVGEFASIVEHMDMAASKYQDMFNATNEYMRARGLPGDLREQVRDFVQIKFEERKLYDEESILSQLPSLLRKKVLHFNTKEIFARVPVLRFAPLSTSLVLSELLVPTTLFPGDVIFEINTMADACYFIYNGSVEIFLPGYALGRSRKARKLLLAGSEDISCAKLGNGCYFGDAGVVLDHSQKRTASARVGPEVPHCDMYAISKAKFVQFCGDYPNLWSHLRMVAARRVARVRHRQGLLEHLPPLFRADLEDLRASQIHHKRATQEETKSRKELYAFDEGDDGDDEGGGGRREKGGSRDWDQLSELSDEKEISAGSSGAKVSNGGGRLGDETKGNGDGEREGIGV
eukprot:g3225.t1